MAYKRFNKRVTSKVRTYNINYMKVNLRIRYLINDCGFALLGFLTVIYLSV